jgi:hypothetical protein
MKRVRGREAREAREAREVRAGDGRAPGREKVGCGVVSGLEDRLNTLVARVFWEATTRHSCNTEDILPQEGGQNGDHSVFHVFALVFPEIVGAKGAGGASPCLGPCACACVFLAGLMGRAPPPQP